MKISFIDTNIIIRALTEDDLEMAKASRERLSKVKSGEEVVVAPVAVIYEVVHVLEKGYPFPKQRIRDSLKQIIRLPGFKMENKALIFEALDIYVSADVPFIDAVLAATMKSAEISEIYSYDKHFDKLEGIKRIEP